MTHRDDEKDPNELSIDDPAHTASREAADRARAGLDPTPYIEKDEHSAAESAGGIVGGAAAGAAGGTVTLGPIGTVVGALAGALGGWWASAGAASAPKEPNEEDDRRWRAHYDSATRPADRRYEDARMGYQLGALARRNPDYAGRSFEEVEPDLSRGWSEEMRRRYGEWAGMRNYVRAAYVDTGAPQRAVGSAELQDRAEEG